MGFIDKGGLEKIKKHAYVSGTSTYIDDALQPFWNGAALLIPTRVAPNLVTLSGFLFPLSISILLVWHDPSMREPPPIMYHAIGALCLCIYQQLDAMDGKHARNTKQSSPLGQLFDHGVDSMVVVLMNHIMSSCLQLGSRQVSFTLLCSFTLNFYCGQWEEYHTHVMTTNFISIIGVTEGKRIFLEK